MGFRNASMQKRGMWICAFLHFCVSAFLMSGCARAHAKAAPETPPLDVPAPPPRVVELLDVEATPPARSPEEPARPAPLRPRPAPPRPEPPKAEAAPKPEPPKAEAAKTEPPPSSEAPKVADEAPKPSTPATTLQTTPAGSEGDVERSIRASLARAGNDLNRVNYRSLNADARTQYDTAKRFIQQAEEAARDKNLTFAKNLAEKASALAAQLAGK